MSHKFAAGFFQETVSAIVMHHSATLPFHGDSSQALNLAIAALTSIGFRLSEHTPESLDMTGPGMNNTRASALTGASRIQFRAGAGELSLDAELGGVQRMVRFVTWFPPLLCLFLGVVLSVVF